MATNTRAPEPNGERDEHLRQGVSTFTSFKPSGPAKPNSNQQQTNVDITAAVEIVWSLNAVQIPNCMHHHDEKDQKKRYSGCPKPNQT